MKRLILFYLCSLLLFFACSIDTEQHVRRIPADTREITSISLPFTPTKAAYSNLDNSLYLMARETNTIHIYRNGIHVNTIGGLGFGEGNFNRLSDIAVSPHGRLLALDSFQKTIKKFDRDGMWLENYPISFLNEPILFDVSHDGMVFVYDRTSNEIAIYDEQMENIVYRFGKFLLRNPVQINCTFQHVSVYDRMSDKTFIFDLFGNVIETLNGFWQIDRYKNRYRLTTSKISSYPEFFWERSGRETREQEEIKPERDLLISVKPWNTFHIKRGLIVLTGERLINVSEILYERD